ncbi:TetR/AcrR family transcriptional regulator [Corynebacterium halotolerans]|uniref:TetR/AcrR family transcriptional regulator n=1 Tax=Corynebacterium halotolerans TaxID=225326 RepID=UPI003CFA4480
MSLDESDFSALDARDVGDESVSPEQVISAAVEEFAEHGYTDTKLEQIAKLSGMSKRMIHYHFGDKLGLYLQALAEAMARLHPDPEDMELDSTVPVEGVRKLVDAIFLRFAEHPEAVRMILLENLHHYADLKDFSPIPDEASITLHLDKLLMLGQDAGAFRPGISAYDVFLLISALSCYPVSNGETALASFGVDLGIPDNQSGIHRLVVDSVLAFLTSNIPHSGEDSYLVPVGDGPSSQVGQDIYGDET